MSLCDAHSQPPPPLSACYIEKLRMSLKMRLVEPIMKNVQNEDLSWARELQAA